MLALLASRGSVINSLTIDDDSNYAGPNMIHPNDLKGLNMDSLGELILMGLTSETAEPIMDLALQSTHEEMRVELNMLSITYTLLRHDLVRRSTRLDISAGQ
jgi:hypothetical protein